MAPALTQPKNGNGEQTTTLAQNVGPLATLLKYTQDPETKRRMSEMLGQRAGSFLNSIINVTKNSKQLQDIAKVNPQSIMASAMVAASVNLPIDPALGFAAIVPYSGKNPAAQFQLMFKGLIQLAIRSGQYVRIHDTEVYKDEIKSYNPITGEIEFNDPGTYKMRYEGKVEDVAGFYTFFRLKTGFEASKYISFEEAMAHGRRFSKAYQYDLNSGKKASLWSTDPLAMGRKTCIKMLLGKYGILSIEMQDAFVAEGDDFSPDVPQHVDATVVEGPEVGGVQGLKARMMQQDKPVENDAGAGEGEAAQDQTKPAADPSPSAQEEPKADPTPATDSTGEGKQGSDPTTTNGSTSAGGETSKTEKPKANGKPQYVCKDDDCGKTFYKPNKAKGGLLVCPHCAGTNIEIVTENQQDVDPNAFDNPPTSAEVRAVTGGVVTCPAGHVVERSKLIKSAVVGKNGLGLCPICKNNGHATIVREGN